VHEVPVPPSAHRKDTPKRLELIVLKALKKSKKQRYRTADEMLDDLDTVDIDDIVAKPTVSFRLSKQKATADGSDDHYNEKRITDRRFSDRRKESVWRYAGIFGMEFWAELARTQGLSLLLIALLAIILAIHLFNHP